MPILQWLFGVKADVVRDEHFQILLVANITGVMGVSLVSPILDSLSGPFGVDATTMGLMISAVTAPSIVMIPIFGLIADRTGRKPLIVIGLTLFGIGGTAISLTSDFQVALGLRLLQGVGTAAIVPVIIASIGDLYDGGTEATAQGLRFTASGISQTFFPLLAGVLVTFAWQYPFLLHSIALLAAVLVAVRFEEPDSPEKVHDSSSRSSQLRALRDFLLQRRLLSLILARSLPTIIWFGILTYNSVIVVQLLEGTPGQAGALVAAGSLVYALSSSQAGRVTTHFDSRYYPLLAVNILIAVGYTIFAFASTIWGVALGIILSGAGFGIALSLYRSIITGLAPHSLRGGIVSISESFARAMATLTPIGMGFAIGVARPTLGLGQAIRWTTFGVACLVCVASLSCLIVAHVSPPVMERSSEARSETVDTK